MKFPKIILKYENGGPSLDSEGFHVRFMRNADYEKPPTHAELGRGSSINIIDFKSKKKARSGHSLT